MLAGQSTLELDRERLPCYPEAGRRVCLQDSRAIFAGRTKGEGMQFKEGSGWKACRDNKTGRCTASWFTCDREGCERSLYEIPGSVFSQLRPGSSESGRLIVDKGRLLYRYVDNCHGGPYSIVFDEDWRELCAWADNSKHDDRHSMDAKMIARALSPRQGSRKE